MTEITCNKCGKKCFKPTKEINRQIKKGKKVFYCSISCATVVSKTTTKKVKSLCSFCNKEFETTTHKKHRKCCSKLCVNRYVKTFINKEKQSNLVKSLWKSGVYDKLKVGRKIHDLKCIICENNFKNINKKVKTCGDECYRKLISKNSRENPNCGGETNYKKYRYKDIWMDSTWELELAKWMDKNDILWERNRKKHCLWWTDNNNKKRRYYPDFFLPDYDLYVDTKNPYLMKCDKEKIDKVKKECNVQLIVDSLNNTRIKIQEMITF